MTRINYSEISVAHQFRGFVLRLPVTGEYLKSFDPNRHAPARPYPTGHAEFTSDPENVLLFATVEDAIDFYHQQSAAVPIRPDGSPNRPLTAFPMDVEPAPAIRRRWNQ